jgi:uncharacterized protein involved in type VI secretion and phage assembly
MDLERVVADLVEKVERRFYGKHRGFVVDNQDPAKLGRLKLRVPGVLGPDVVTGWALPCTPYGGAADQGFLFIPEVDAGVWVEFEEGDLEFPIWVGTFWSQPGGDSELPKPNKADGSEESSVQDPPTSKIIKTLRGHTLQFEDADGSEMITLIEGAKGHVVTLNADGIKLTDGANSDDANSQEMVLDGSGIRITDKNGNSVTLDQSGIVVEDKNGNKVTLDQSGAVIEDKNQNRIEMSASAISILPAVACNLGSSALNPVNNLPACLFTGAPHAADLKGHAKVLK